MKRRPLRERPSAVRRRAPAVRKPRAATARAKAPVHGTVRVLRDIPGRLLGDASIQGAVRAALEHGNRAGIDVDVVLVGDRALAELHARFLDDPTPTDVITFDLDDAFGGAAAELYVSVERARAVARRRGIDARRELLLYVVHGALHLCGFDDHAPRERARMRAAERAVLARLELARRR